MQRSRRRALYLGIVAMFCMVAGCLIPAAAAPEPERPGATRVPTTLMRSVSFDGARGRVALAFRPTHIGFKWEGSHDSRVSYRTIDESGRASKWQVAPLSHDMEVGTTRFSGLVAVDRPVNVEYRKRPGTDGGDWMGAITLESINTLDGPRREVMLGSSTAADPSAPDIITRAEWGADESIKRATGGCKRSFSPLRQLFVHHTAGSNYDYSGAATMRAIYAYHVQSRGWCDIGYNFVIDWRGHIFEGRWARKYAPWEVHDSEDHRNFAVVGAHVGGYNTGSVGISLMGNFTNVGPPQAMKQSLKAMLAWEADRHGLNPTGRHTFNGRRMPVIAGHRNAGQTACPGNKVYSQLPKFRRKTKELMGRGRKATTLSLKTSAGSIRHGGSVQAFGNLSDESGKPLAGRPVTIYRKFVGGQWKENASLTTGDSGEFSTALHPTRRVSISASFSTRPDYWGSDSRTARVSVRHVVTMAPTDRAPDSDGVYHYAPSDKRALVGGEVRPSHAGKTVRLRLYRLTSKSGYRRIATKKPVLDAEGHFSHSFWLPARESGERYKIVAEMLEDGVHTTGSSGPRFLVFD
jgi:N-acetylmuramoyl-L-alanine amidase